MSSEWQSRALSLLRLMTGLVLLQYGLQKMFGLIPGGPIQQQSFGTLIWFAGAVELVGGALLTVGLFTRCAAFVVSGQMAFAYFIGHAGRAFFPLLNGGGLAIILCFVCLYLAAAGGGSISLDARRNA
jgi:putative oxidoreductase